MGVEKMKAAFENGKKAFIPYVMGGDGGLEKLKERIRFLDEAGASIVEIGIPFSDPVADGPDVGYHPGRVAGSVVRRTNGRRLALLEGAGKWPLVLACGRNGIREGARLGGPVADCNEPGCAGHVRD